MDSQRSHSDDTQDDRPDLITRRAFGQVLGAGAVAAPRQTPGTNADAKQGRSTASVSKPDEICDLSAVDLAARIRRKDLSAREVLSAHLARIERINPKVNAIVTMVTDRAIADAARADEQMARSVADVALFLSAIAGPDPRNPLYLGEDGARFRAPLDRNFTGVRVAWWQGLGGIPFEPDIRRVVDANRRVIEMLGCQIEDAEPDFAGVDEAFLALRCSANHPRNSALLRQRPEWVKDTIKYEAAQAESLTGADIGRAIARQTRMYEQSRTFFEPYEYFVLPVTQVSPFDVNTPYPTQIGGTPMTTYIDWMRSCWYITMMANPAISVPAGFTPSGLPVGLQIVGRHRDEWSVLQLAHAFETATRHGQRRPPLLGA
jgi:Asp-tRNA(Asn)/Glu-tRNA(Gln) amidotransferase A subunit family amidase